MKWSYNVTTIAKGKLQIPASHKIVAFRIISGRRIVETVTRPLSRLPWRLRIKLQTGEASGEQGMAQCWERSPPTSVARVQIPASTPYLGWPLLERFFSGYSGFPLSSDLTFPNSNSTINQVEEERYFVDVPPSLFYLFIIWMVNLNPTAANFHYTSWVSFSTR